MPLKDECEAGRVGSLLYRAHQRGRFGSLLKQFDPKL